jgi:phosphatidylserine/phosphatidylglycerophosphate/cardiolipin synthase-like enzyme
MSLPISKPNQWLTPEVEDLFQGYINYLVSAGKLHEDSKPYIEGKLFEKLNEKGQLSALSGSWSKYKCLSSLATHCQPDELQKDFNRFLNEQIFKLDQPAQHVIRQLFLSNTAPVAQHEREHQPLPIHAGNIRRFYTTGVDSVARDSGLFHDIAQSIDAAKSRVIISAWNMPTRFDLGLPGNKTIAQRLVDKAAQGVPVYVSIWSQGLRRSQSEKYDWYAKPIDDAIAELPKAQQAMARRNLRLQLSPAEHMFGSDHRKFVVTDDTLYLGGFDLSYARDDTPGHITLSPELLPWHDAHVQMTGPVTDACIQEFFEHWDALGTEANLRLAGQGEVDFAARTPAVTEFNHDVSVGSPATVEYLAYSAARRQGKKPAKKDTPNDLLKAHLEAVERAAESIHIENQYVIAELDDTKDATRQILSAIALKIKAAHDRGENFKVTFVMPKETLGISKVDRDVLRYKQWKTMQWFKKEVKKYVDPTSDDFNRVDEYVDIFQVEKTTFVNGRGASPETEVDSQDIYIHSKLFLVDDSEMLVGSNALSNRSLLQGHDYETALHIRANGDANVQAKIKGLQTDLRQQHGIEEKSGDGFTVRRDEYILELARRTLQAIERKQNANTHQSRRDALCALKAELAKPGVTADSLLQTFETQRAMVDGVKKRARFSQFNSDFLTKVGLFQAAVANVKDADTVTIKHKAKPWHKHQFFKRPDSIRPLPKRYKIARKLLPKSIMRRIL